MSFYTELEILKKTYSVTNEMLGEWLNKKADTVRKALNRESLSTLEKKAILVKFREMKGVVTDSEIEYTVGQKEKTGHSRTPLVSHKHGVPYYDVDFQGGLGFIENDQTVSPSFYIDFPPYNDSDCWINVTGKSMSPFISHGDIAALKQLRDWKEFITFGEIYAIYTSEHRTIKIVTAGNDKDHFKLIPYNKSPEFVEQEIPKHLIKAMFRVNGAIKKFF